MTTARLEVFADLWCPFAHVGLRAAADARASRGRDDVALVIRAWPLELVNGAPQDPAAAAAHVRELREQVAPGLFAHFDESSFPHSTLEALALVEFAYDQSAALGEALSFALRDALFEEGLDISRREVLEEVAATLALTFDELDEDAVRSSWREGQARGVRGSPHFFCRGAESFCPSLDIRRGPEGRLDIRRRAVQLEEFLEQCFATLDG